MIATLARHTFRECFRRPFPYVAGVSVVLLTLGSKLFLAFSFGAARTETINLGISAVFLAGLLHAAFQGTYMVRADLERGTLGLLLTKPASLPAYVLGRFAGLALASAALCLAVAAAVSAVFLLLPLGSGGSVAGPTLAAGCLRALLPVFVLDAAALAASALAPRVAAPLALLALLLAGSLAGGAIVLPDFSLFGLEATAAPSWLLLCTYTAIYASIFLVVTFIVLGRKQPLRSQR